MATGTTHGLKSDFRLDFSLALTESTRSGCAALNIENALELKIMKSILKFIDLLYSWFLRLANLGQHPFLLAVRLYFGWQFFQTGLGKLQDISKVVDYFTSLGIPAPALNAHFIAWLETGGGILLMLGLGSRLIALPMAIDMIVAYVKADNEALHSVISEPDKFTAAAPYNFLFVFLLILFLGPGFFSLDTLIRWFTKEYAQPESTAAKGVLLGASCGFLVVFVFLKIVAGSVFPERAGVLGYTVVPLGLLVAILMGVITARRQKKLKTAS